MTDIKESERRSDLLRWLNKQINRLGAEASDFEDSFKDPRVVAAMVKSLEPAAIDLDTITADNAIESIDHAMDVAEDKLDIMRNMGAEMMVEAPDEERVVQYVEEFQAVDKRRKLLAWVNTRLAAADVSVTNFTSNFQDPLVVSALLNSFLPGLIDLGAVSEPHGDQAVDDVRRAMDIAGDLLGVRANMSPEDMVSDPQADVVAEYVTSITRQYQSTILFDSSPPEFPSP